MVDSSIEPLINRIKWNPIIKGAVFAIIVGTLLSIFAESTFEFIAYILAAMYVGYSVKGNNINRAIHGSIVAFISSLIVAIITGLIAMTTDEFNSMIILLDILAIIINTIIGAIAGVMGTKTKGIEWIRELEGEILLKGTFLAIILGTILGLITEIGEFLAYFIVAIYVGYNIKGDYNKGAMYGVLIAIIGTIIVSIIMGIILKLVGNEINSFESMMDTFLFLMVTITTILLLIIDIIAGAIGGAIGAFIYSIRQRNTQ